MAQNAVLAICAALWLGVSAEQIQRRLENWQPAKLRGELRQDEGRLLYLDCYNANPASMADALDAFYAIAPDDQPRLFVLGGMEELGREAEMFHRALGRSLRLAAAGHFAGDRGGGGRRAKGGFGETVHWPSRSWWWLITSRSRHGSLDGKARYSSREVAAISWRRRLDPVRWRCTREPIFEMC